MFALVLLHAACSSPADTGTPPEESPTLAPPADGEGFQLTMFGTAPAHEETWLCSVYNLPTTEVAPVNSVTYLQNANTHHLSLSTTALSGIELTPGTYDCEDLYADSDLMAGVTTFFGNQGAPEDTLQLPEGVAALLPAGMQVLHEIHYVNPFDEDIELYSYINAWTIPSDEVTDTIWGGQVRDETIEIPPNTTHTEWTRCVMNEEVQVQFLASHTHSTGISFTIAPFDGTTTGEILYENTDWHDPRIIQYEDPMVVPAGQGFEFACTWENTSTDTVGYGFSATDEMCNMAIVFTPGNPNTRCEVVETSDGVLWTP